jgi:hypothetical protein
MTRPIELDKIRKVVNEVVEGTPILDIHTHLYAPAFDRLLLWGVDEMLTYHYLLAEFFRASAMPYDQFWAMDRQTQADAVWKHLFIERSPLSEACRGVLTVLAEFGLDVATRDLTSFRRHFAQQSIEKHVETVLAHAHVRSLIMTNDPFDDQERPIWEGGWKPDAHFQSALRLDQLLNHWPEAVQKLAGWGYKVSGDLGEADRQAVRCFLRNWIERMQPRYLGVSLPPTFTFPDSSPCGRIIESCLMPVARDADLPVALMIGVRRGVNPAMRLAADAVGKADITAVDRLCRAFPENRFLATMLSRENQHELCVSARKHPNLHVFGCWWFVNVPSIVEEITRERFELLGLTYTPQHSDARVLEQLIYKWSHTRSRIAHVLTDKYTDLACTGWPVTRDDIERDVEGLFGGNFEHFCRRSTT